MRKTPTLDKLLQPITTQQFFAEYFEKKHLIIRGRDRHHYDDILNINDLDVFFQNRQTAASGIDLVKEGQAIPIRAWAYLNSNERLGYLANNHKLLAQYNDGATIILSSAEGSIPKLSDFHLNVEHELDFRCQCNLYLTPGSSRGFDLHHDDHDVFILQTMGTKLWKVYDAKVSLPTDKWSHLGPYTEDELDEPIEEFVLEEGDLLYIPRGLIHCACTTNEASAHVTLGLHPVCIYELLKALVKKAEDLEELRESAPFGLNVGRSNGELESLLREKFGELLQETDIDDLLTMRRGMNRQARARPMAGRFSSMFQIDSIGLTTVLTREPAMEYQLLDSPEDNTVKVILPGRELPFPAFMKNSIESLLNATQLSVQDISGLITDSGRVELAKTLVKEGALVIKVADEV